MKCTDNKALCVASLMRYELFSWTVCVTSHSNCFLFEVEMMTIYKDMTQWHSKSSFPLILYFRKGMRQRVATIPLSHGEITKNL